MDYSRQLIESLALCAPVHALAFGDPDVAVPPAPGLSWTLVSQAEPPRWASLISPLPNVAFRHQGSAYLRTAIEAAQTADAVFVDFIGLFALIGPLRRALRGRAPIIAVNHNFEHHLRLQMVAAEKAPLMRTALAYDTWKAGILERHANRLADGLTANNPADLALFNEITAKPGALVMPAYDGARLPPRTIDAATPARICILGNHDAHHKRMVLERTLTALSAKGVERCCIVDVVGGGETKSFAAKFPGFHYHGYIDDLAGYLRTVRLGLIPDDIGGGFKLRALTHAFQRLPMLAVRSALHGMGFTEGTHFAAVESIDDLADASLAFLDDFPRLNGLQAAAYNHCASMFDSADRGQTLHALASRLHAVRA